MLSRTAVVIYYTYV